MKPISLLSCAALLLSLPVVGTLDAQDPDWTVIRTPDSRFENLEGYRAPFHTEEATAGAKQWPWILPFARPADGGANRQERAFEALASWDRPAHVIFGAEDPIFTPAWGREFANHIPGATFDTVPGAGHFVQETGAPLAELILEKIRSE